MKIALLIFFLVPVFIFQSFIVVDLINTIRIPVKESPTGMGTIHFNNERASRKSNLRVIK